jgi:hypothetical protein
MASPMRRRRGILRISREAFDEVSEALKKHKEDKIFKMDGPVDAKAKEPDPNAAKRVKRTDEDLLILALAARLC